jgi:hypothetical protein
MGRLLILNANTLTGTRYANGAKNAKKQKPQQFSGFSNYSRVSRLNWFDRCLSPFISGKILPRV